MDAILSSSLGSTFALTVGVPIALRFLQRVSVRWSQRKHGVLGTSPRAAAPGAPTPPVESRRASNVRLLLLFAMLGLCIGRIVLSPIDPFTSFGLSVTVPASTLRKAYALRHGDAIPLADQRTLGLLSTLENRLAYLRYGEASAFNPLCAAASGAGFRIWVAMARRLASYAFAAAVIGLLTETCGRSRWRRTLAVLLMAGYAAEGWALYTGRWDREAKVR